MIHLESFKEILFSSDWLFVIESITKVTYNYRQYVQNELWLVILK